MSEQPKRYRLMLTVDADNYGDLEDALSEVSYRLDLFEDTARVDGLDDSYHCHSADYEFSLKVKS